MDEEKLMAMIADFVRRSDVRQTAAQIRQTMTQCPTLVLEDGFLVLGIYQDECSVLYMYIRPGAKLLPLFEFVTEDVARYHKCRTIRFISRRTPRAIARTRPAYRPCATVYERELAY